MVDGLGTQVDPVSDPDVALMQAFVAGDEAAFSRLYEAYRDRIVNYTRRMLGNEARAEEAAQDVFLKLYRSRARYEPRSRFSTYLYRIATNHCLNLRARLDSRMEASGALPELHADQSADASEGLSRGQLRDALRAALAELPDNQRTALLLVHYEGLSYRDAADVIEVSEGAIKSLVHRARSRLTETLRPVMEEIKGVSHAV